ncbi:MAG TPA: hypothetical protein VKZ79_09325 [Alphaproteobacteria bacterium]|nr:hypothetical protein [Alphaproteobacteria bacterium]
MFMGPAAVARAMQVGLDFAEVSTKAGETASASSTVIGERVALMVAAAWNPLAADCAEFARMLPEKAAAISQAGAGLLGGWWTLHRDVGDYMLYLARVMTTCELPWPGDVAELMERTLVHGTRVAASPIDAAGAVLAPFHESAVSNARRLSRGSAAPRDSSLTQNETRGQFPRHVSPPTLSGRSLF